MGLGNLMPEGAGWKVCGYSLTGLENRGRYGSASLDADGWRQALHGVPEEPDYGCYYYDVLDFMNSWPAHNLHDRFVVTCEGLFSVQEPGTYTWKICGDDGLLIVIDNTVLSTDSWRLQGYRCYEQSTTLEPGTHQIQVVMYEWYGGDKLRLYGGPGKGTEAVADNYHEISSAPVRGLCYNNEKYFTLGEQHAMTASSGCQTDAKELPAWAQLAPNTETTLNLVGWSKFGASCLVLEDGSSHKTADKAAEEVPETTVELDTETSSKKKKTSTSLKTEKSISEVGWTVEHQTVECSGNACTWSYKVTVASWEKDLSHWVLELSSGCNIVSSTGFGGIDLDPTTGLVGAKYDTQINKNTDVVLSLTITGDSTAVARSYTVKGGTYFAKGSTVGPSCGNTDGATSTTVTTGTLDIPEGSTDCGTSKLVSTGANVYNADCADGINRRILAKKAGCDPGDVDIASHVIKNFVTLKGRRYATIDDAYHHAAPTGDGCGYKPAVVPDGWSIAPFNNDNMLVNAYGNGVLKFGTNCVIYSDGKGRSSSPNSFGETCAVDAIEALDVTSGPSLIRVVNFCGRILITQDAPDGEADTIPVDAPAQFSDVTKTKALMGYHYAVLDNTASTERTSGCQSTPFHLPSGWELVPYSDIAKTVFRHFPFGTSCLVTDSGAGIASGSFTSGCGDNILYSLAAHGTVYYTAKECNSRVVMRHKEVFDQAALAETCGICTGWGDPHLTTFDRTRYDSYGGEQILHVTSPNPDYKPCATFNDPTHYCDFNVYTWQVPLGHVATNKAVMVRHVGATGVEEKITIIVDHTIKVRSNIAHLEIDNMVVDLSFEVGSMTTTQGASVKRVLGRRNKPGWLITLPNAIKVEVSSSFWKQPLLDYKVTLPKRFRGTHTVFGLCGDCDSDHSNDYYNPVSKTPVDKSSITGSRKEKKAKIQNDFVNTNRVDGDNPIPPTPEPMPPVVVSDPTAPGACDIVSGKVLDLIDVCCADLVDEEYELCRDEVCINGGCASIEVLEEVNTAADEVITQVDDTPPTCAEASTANTVELPNEKGGRTYAVLDGASNTSPLSPDPWQSVDLSLPTGWSIAPRDEINIAMASCLPFGTDCLVLADGSGISTDGSARQCGTNLIIRSGTNGVCMRPTGSNMRILIMKDLDSAVQEVLVSADLTTSSGWFPENPSDNITPVTDDEDPSGNSFSTVTSTERRVQGLQRQFGPMPTLSGVQFTQWTKPFSASVWVRLGDDAAVNQDALPSEWYYAQADFLLENGDTLSTRAFPFSRSGANVVSRGWEQLVLDLNLPKLYAKYYTSIPHTKVTSMTVHLVMNQMTGSVQFGVPVFSTSKPQQFNIVKNGDFNQDILPADGDAYVNWLVTAGSPAVDRSTSSQGLGGDPTGGSGALVLSGAGKQQATVMHDFGSTNQNMYDESAPNTMMICTWHKASELDGVESAGSSLYVDFLCNEEGVADYTNCAVFGQAISTHVGTTGWYQSCRSFVTRGASLTGRVAITARMIQGSSTSKSYFDGVFAMPSCEGSGSFKPDALVYGDPHIITGDGVKYDVQSLGEYTVFRNDEMIVQQRHVQAGYASIVSAIAVTQIVSGTLVQVNVPKTNQLVPIVRVNGQVVSNLPRVEITNDSGSVIIRRTGSLVSPSESAFGSVLRYSLLLRGTESRWDESSETYKEVGVYNVIDISIQNTKYGTSLMNVNFPRPTESSHPSGLLGNFNGDPTDDFIGADGVQYSNAATSSSDLNAFAESWRVKKGSDSLFVYERGEDLQTYYNPDFVPFSLSTASEDEVAAATETCVNAGVPDSHLEVCKFDVLAGGDGFVVAAAGISSSYNDGETEALYDAPSSSDATGEETLTSEGTGVLLAVISSIAGATFFTCICCGLVLLVGGIVAIRVLRVTGWTLINRRDERADLLQRPKGAIDFTNAATSSVDVDYRKDSIVARQLSNAVQIVANLLNDDQDGPRPETPTSPMKAPSPIKRRRYSSLANLNDEPELVSASRRGSNVVPNAGRSLTSAVRVKVDDDFFDSDGDEDVESQKQPQAEEPAPQAKRSYTAFA